MWNVRQHFSCIALQQDRLCMSQSFISRMSRVSRQLALDLLLPNSCIASRFSSISRQFAFNLFCPSFLKPPHIRLLQIARTWFLRMCAHYSRRLRASESCRPEFDGGLRKPRMSFGGGDVNVSSPAGSLMLLVRRAPRLG